MILNEKAARFESQSQFLALQGLGVRTAKNRQEDLVFQAGPRWVPIDVKKRGVCRGRAVFEHVHPPGILATSRHVVGDDIEEETHPLHTELSREGFELLLTSNLT